MSVSVTDIPTMRTSMEKFIGWYLSVYPSLAERQIHSIFPILALLISERIPLHKANRRSLDNTLSGLMQERIHTARYHRKWRENPATRIGAPK
jgi:hypothetical protein